MTALRFWLFIVCLVTFLSGSMYAVGQTILRQSANDPQIQLSEDMAFRLAQGKEKAISLGPTVDISRSLAPFTIVLDQNGHIASSTATFAEGIPLIPRGVLAYAKTNGQNILTWMPRNHLRFATVVTYYSGSHQGYVLVARSLREIEHRQNQLVFIVGFGWAVTVGVSLVGIILFRGRKRK